MKDAMIKAGCAVTVSDIGKNRDLVIEALKYHSYMRRRFSLLRLTGLLDFDGEVDLDYVVE